MPFVPLATTERGTVVRRLGVLVTGSYCFDMADMKRRTFQSGRLLFGFTAVGFVVGAVVLLAVEAHLDDFAYGPIFMFMAGIGGAAACAISAGVLITTSRGLRDASWSIPTWIAMVVFVLSWGAFLAVIYSTPDDLLIGVAGGVGSWAGLPAGVALVMAPRRYAAALDGDVRRSRGSSLRHALQSPLKRCSSCR
ncbi:MAG: hypothetical protein JWP75_2234 [Frondihabitans sp.]|nr:hypothetical protein [Frondihabitans sp.]